MIGCAQGKVTNRWRADNKVSPPAIQLVSRSASQPVARSLSTMTMVRRIAPGRQVSPAVVGARWRRVQRKVENGERISAVGLQIKLSKAAIGLSLCLFVHLHLIDCAEQHRQLNFASSLRLKSLEVCSSSSYSCSASLARLR